MSEMEPKERALQAHDDLIKLGDLSVRFAGVERLTYYEHGRPENDAEHSYHLAISAVEMAAAYHPELNVGLVSQFCLVHDLPEVYAGDTPSFRLSAEERLEKQRAEKVAQERLLTELPPYLAHLLKRYEEQVEPEARFVRFMDKLMPAVIHAVATEQNRDVFLGKYSINSREDLEKGSDRRSAIEKNMFPEFDFLHILRDLTSATARQSFFPS